jgi:hypothetical protein
MIWLHLGWPLCHECQSPRDYTVAVRRGIEAIVAQHHLDAAGRMLNRGMMTAI